MKRKGIVYIFLILASLLLNGCSVVSRASTFSEMGPSTLEEELVKQKAVSITMAMYSGCTDYIKGESSDNARNHVLGAMGRLNNSRLEKITLQGFAVNEDMSISLQIQVYEDPYETAIFHDMIFKKVNDKWILYSFETDI